MTSKLRSFAIAAVTALAVFAFAAPASATSASAQPDCMSCHF